MPRRATAWTRCFSSWAAERTFSCCFALPTKLNAWWLIAMRRGGGKPDMHARIFLVRHGATVLTKEDRFAGATDVELSDEGREQVRRLAVRLGGEKIAAIYASPLGRTVETARILAKPHNLEVQ